MQTLAGFSIALVVLMFSANLVAIHYTRGALRAAAAAGARAGAMAGGSWESCELRAETVLFGDSGLLRGPYGSDARVRCIHLGTTVQAIGSATAPWWIDVLPPAELQVAAEAVVERVPVQASPP